MKHPSLIAIEEFTYDLPQEKIAAFPLEKRDDSKLLIYKDEQIQTSVFSNLPQFFQANTTLVFNNTSVIQARLNFVSEKEKPIEVFCLEPSANRDVSLAMSDRGTTRWNCLVGNLRNWKDQTLIMSQQHVTLKAEIINRETNYVEIDLSWQPSNMSFGEMLENTGAMPIPPYLKRQSDNGDKTRYQTVYASEKGSVAAPTAGLHFTELILQKLDAQGAKRLEVTLHVGAGTFKPVKSAQMSGHDMHAEWIEVSLACIQQLKEKKDGKIIAVGTTSLRTIESLYWMGFKAMLHPDATLSQLEVTQWEPYDLKGEQPGLANSLSALTEWMRKRNLEVILCRTSILIAPPYNLKVADGIITNFHQPQSTLLLLISAIVGEKWKSIYDFALKNDFRFLSYGDSSLLLK